MSNIRNGHTVRRLFEEIVDSRRWPTNAKKHATLAKGESSGKPVSPYAACSSCTTAMCCSTEDPIALTSLDILKLAVGLDLSVPEFLSLYTQEEFADAENYQVHVTKPGTGIVTHLRRKTNYEASSCIFLVRVQDVNNQYRYTCSAHEYRPMACREYFYDGCSQSNTGELAAMLASGMEKLGDPQFDRKVREAWAAIKHLDTSLKTLKSIANEDKKPLTGDYLMYFVTRKLMEFLDHADEPIQPNFSYRGDTKKVSRRMLSTEFGNALTSFELGDGQKHNMTHTDIFEQGAGKLGLKLIEPGGNKIKFNDANLQHYREKLTTTLREINCGERRTYPEFVKDRLEIKDKNPLPQDYGTRLEVSVPNQHFPNAQFYISAYTQAQMTKTAETPEEKTLVSSMCYMLNVSQWMLDTYKPDMIPDDDDISGLYGELAMFFSTLRTTPTLLTRYPILGKGVERMCKKILPMYRQSMMDNVGIYEFCDPHKEFDEVKALSEVLDVAGHVFTHYDCARSTNNKNLVEDAEKNITDYLQAIPMLDDTIRKLSRVDWGKLFNTPNRLAAALRTTPENLMFDDDACELLYSLVLHPYYLYSLKSHLMTDSSDLLARYICEDQTINLWKSTLKIIENTLNDPRLHSQMSKSDTSAFFNVYNILTHLAYGMTLYGRVPTKHRAMARKVNTLTGVLYGMQELTNIHDQDPETVAEYIDACTRNLGLPVGTNQSMYVPVIKTLVRTAELNGSVNTQRFNRSQRFTARVANIPPFQDNFLYGAYHGTWTVVDALRSHIFKLSPAVDDPKDLGEIV